MQLFYTDTFVLPLPAGHRFPMEKYSRLRQALLASGDFAETDFLLPQAASDDELALAHDRDYIARVCHGRLSEKEQKAIGFPWSPAMVERSRRSAGATIGACRAALTAGVSGNLAGGTHHAFRDRGEGFCVFNDAAVAARLMLAEGRVERILIVDCDVHQGNGTASILADDERVFTLSLHGARNYPFTKEKSDLDVELPDACDDTTYLERLDHALTLAWDLARPQLAIYLAGADPFRDDRFGRLQLSHAGLAERDRRVLQLARATATPIALAMAGGYARDIADTVAIHCTTLRLAQALCSRPAAP